MRKCEKQFRIDGKVQQDFQTDGVQQDFRTNGKEELDFRTDGVQ